MKKRAIVFCAIVLFVVSCAAPQSLVTSTPDVTSTVTVSFTPSPIPTITATAYLTPTPPAALVTSGDWTLPYVALTFDMCQDPLYPAGYDARIVEVLQRYNVAATFFMGGDWMRTHPDETRLLGANPNFELGNHSWSHADFTTLTVEKMGQEIAMTEDVMFQLTGKRSHLFRFPSGFYNDTALQVVSEHGLYAVQWDSVTGDPDPTFDAATILAEVQRTVQNGSIIIMHGNGRGWHTAEALPLVIDYLQSKGYTLVTVSQLINLEPLPVAE